MAIEDRTKENTGAWIIHHGRKLSAHTRGRAEYPAIDLAAQAATLLVRLGETNEVTLTQEEVRAVALAAGLNPNYELPGLLQTLEDKRLIDQAGTEVALLGITTRGALGHANDIFEDASPTTLERASIDLAEIVSETPKRRTNLAELIGDTHAISRKNVNEFLDSAEGIGFVDAEDLGGDRVLFNGNLFRRDNIAKASRVLASLGEAEQRKMREANDNLAQNGCMSFREIEKILIKPLFEKLRAAGLYDINVVGNESGEHAYVTAPSAFHKFVNPIVDDCFDLAKSLVAALTYGMTERSPWHGRITYLGRLLQKLVNGGEVGPATAIGKDYRVLEMDRVVKLRADQEHPGRFYMRLLKREVGELAIQVLTIGDAAPQALSTLPTAPMTSYTGPEEARVQTRKKQDAPSKTQTRDILEALRGGGQI